MESAEGPAKCDFQPSTAAGEYNDRWCRKCKSFDHFTENCNVKHTHCCYDCSQPGIGQWLLACQDHLICTSCCTKRASNYCKCQPIWIFVDNSNIWIEAKSYISTFKGFKAHEDPRIRINFGNLINVIAEDRTIAKCFLFGSDYKPSTADTVWQKGVDDGFKVIVDEKSERKEKKVDVRLCVGALTTVHKQKTKGTIVLATGDADFIPLVEKILDDGWKVEVISWEHALSNDYRHLKEDYKCCFKLRYLNEHAETVTFTEYNPPDTYSNPIGAIYVEIHEEKFPIADEKSCKDWCDKVGGYTPCLFQYLWKSKRELTLIYPSNYHKDFVKAININKTHLGIKSFQTPKKVIECWFYENRQCNHIEQPKDCNYAHGNEDALCLLCENHHFTHEHKKLDDT